MRYFLIAAILIAGLEGKAQVKPGFFPEDLTSTNNGLRCYCKPGVRNKSRSKGLELSYGYFGGGAYKAQDTMLTSPLTEFRNHNYLKFGVKAPLMNKDHLKVLLTFSYFSEVYDIKRFGTDFNAIFRELNDTDLKSSRLGLIIAKSLGEYHYVALRFGLAANGNYPGLGRYFDEPYAIYKFYGIYGIKPSEDFEWGIGIGLFQQFPAQQLCTFPPV